MSKFLNNKHWSQIGLLYFWEYKPNTGSIPGFHLSWDKEGKQSLINLLENLESQGSNSYRHVVISQPTNYKLNVPNCGSNYIFRDKLKIILAQDSTVLKLDEKYELYLSHSKLVEFKNKISKVISGKEVNIEIGEEFINFWW